MGPDSEYCLLCERPQQRCAELEKESFELREKLVDDVKKYKLVQQRRVAANAGGGEAAARPTPEQLEAAGVITAAELMAMKTRQGHRFGRGSRMMSPSFD